MARWLNRDVRFRNLGGQTEGETKPRGALSGVTAGSCLASRSRSAGRRCIGPILAAVLVLAANTDTILRGVSCSPFTSRPRIPFLLTAIGINGFLRFLQRFRRHLHTVEVLSGVLLLLSAG